MTKELNFKITLLLIFIITSFCIFGISLPYPFFVFDDSMHITSNPLVGDLSLDNLFYYWQNSKTPLIFNFWQIIGFIFGKESALPFRFVSIVIHGVNSFLVFIWLKEITRHCFKEKEKTNSQIIHLSCLIGALFFLVHPIHTEVVIWISAQKDSLVLLPALFSFIFYLKTQTPTEHKLKYSILSFVFFLIGILIKPSILPLALVFIWLDLTLFSIPLKDITPRYFHYLILGSLVAFMHLKALSDFRSPISLLGKTLVAFDAIRLSIFNTFFPYDLRFDYQRTFNIIGYQINNSFTYQLSILLVGVFIYVSFIALYRKFWKPVHYSMIIFIILLSINMGFIPFLFQNISTVADRYVYLPSIGFALFFCWLTWIYLHRFGQKKYTLLAPSLVIIILAGMSFQQSKLWANSSTLIKKSVQSTYINFATLTSLGTALDEEGHPREAIEYFKTALKIAPESPEAYEHLFRSYTNAGLFELARITLLEMNQKKIDNTSPNLFIDVANYYLKTNEVFKAEDVIRKLETLAKNENDSVLKKAALRLRISMERQKRDKVYNALWIIANLELENKNKEEAMKLFREANEINPEGQFSSEIKLLLRP